SYPPNSECAICTTGTAVPFPPESSFNGSLFVWLRFLGLANGSYTANINNTTTGTECSSSSPVFPFNYNGGGSSVEAWTHNPGSLACSPTSDPAGDASFTALNLNGTSSNHASSLPVTFTISGGPLDVLIRVHLHTCGKTGTFTLTTTLTGPTPFTC